MTEVADLRRRLAETEARLAAIVEFQLLLGETSRAIGPALDLQRVLSVLLSIMRRLIEFRGGSVSLVEGGSLAIAAADPPVGEDVLALRLPLGSGLAGRVALTGKAISCPDLDVDPRVDRTMRGVGSNAGMRSYLVVPILCWGEVIGVLQVDSATPNAFDDDDLRILEGLSGQVGGSIESARRHEELVGLEDSKTDFIARVSHELRTPLTVVSGFVRTLVAADDAISRELRMDILQRMVTATDRLANLVEELLTVTRMDAWSRRVVPELTDLAQVLGEVAEESTRPDAVGVACPLGLTATTDPMVLKQALHLLVQNALAYAGSAKVEARAERGDGIPGVEVAVVDHGPGVPPALLESMWERFVRGDMTSPGMGLGLSLVRTMGGNLRAVVGYEPTPGGGATFTIRLPADSDS